MVKLILGVFILLLLYYSVIFFRDIWTHRNNKSEGNFIVAGVIGFVTDFLDALGIGSFATTTLLFNATHQLSEDEKLPGTLNVAHTIPTLFQALIFTTVIDVQMTTLIPMILAAVVGSYIGSRSVTRLDKTKIQFLMGIALLITSVLMTLKQTGVLTMLGEGNNATGIHGFSLIIAMVGNCIFGMLSAFGVGMYAPCMALVSMLGLNPLVAFPVMMCSSAAVMPVASLNFIRKGSYNRKLSLGISIFGILGVFVASKFVTSMNLNLLTWVVIAIVIYTGISYIRKSRAQMAYRKVAATEEMDD